MRQEHWTLHPEVTFLNHGSFGATPRVVLEEQRRLRDALEREPLRFLAPERDLEPKLDAARERLAALIGARSQDVAIVRNATDGCNAVLHSFPFSEGDEIVITDHGYRACNNAATHAAERAGARVRVAKIPFPLTGPEEVVGAIAAACTDRTRLILVDHVTSPTALVLPVAEIVRDAHARGIRVLVDAAHAPGMMPMDVTASGADYTTGNLHKWLCCPKVAGFLHVREEHQETVRPTTISHAATAARPGRSRFLAEFDWTGTFDPTPFLCLPRALDFLSSLRPGGLEAHMAANHALAVDGARVVRAALGVEVRRPTPCWVRWRSLPDGPPARRTDLLQQRLFEHHRIGPDALAGPGQALGAHLRPAFNELEDYERLAAALRRSSAPVESSGAARSPGFAAIPCTFGGRSLLADRGRAAARCLIPCFVSTDWSSSTTPSSSPSTTTGRAPARSRSSRGRYVRRRRARRSGRGSSTSRAGQASRARGPWGRRAGSGRPWIATACSSSTSAAPAAARRRR